MTMNNDGDRLERDLRALKHSQPRNEDVQRDVRAMLLTYVRTYPPTQQTNGTQRRARMIIATPWPRSQARPARTLAARRRLRLLVVASLALLGGGTATYLRLQTSPGQAPATRPAVSPSPQMTFALPGRPRLVLVDGQAGRGYVMSWDDPAWAHGAGLGTRVAVVDLHSPRVLHAIVIPGSGAGDNSIDMAMDHRNGHLVTVIDGVQRPVTNGRTAQFVYTVRLTLLDQRTARPLRATTAPGLLPSSIVINDATRRVFIGLGGTAVGGTQGAEGSAVVMADSGTGTVLSNRPWRSMVWDLALDRSANRVLVYSSRVLPRGGWWSSNDVSMLDARTGRLLRVVHTGAFPVELPDHWIAVDEAIHRAFIVGRHALLALDTRTGRILGRTALVGNIDTLLTDSTGGRVVVAASTNAGRAYVTVLDARTRRRVATQPIGTDHVVLGLDRRRHRILILAGDAASYSRKDRQASRGKLLIMDDQTGRIVSSYPWGGVASDIAVDEPDDRALVLTDLNARAAQSLLGALLPVRSSPRDSGVTIVDLAHVQGLTPQSIIIDAT